MKSYNTVIIKKQGIAHLISAFPIAKHGIQEMPFQRGSIDNLNLICNALILLVITELTKAVSLSSRLLSFTFPRKEIKQIDIIFSRKESKYKYLQLC